MIVVTEEKIQRLQSVVGVGKHTTTAFVVYLPELGQISDKIAAVLGGVTPFNVGTLRSDL